MIKVRNCLGKERSIRRWFLRYVLFEEGCTSRTKYEDVAGGARHTSLFYGIHISTTPALLRHLPHPPTPRILRTPPELPAGIGTAPGDPRHHPTSAFRATRRLHEQG